MKLVMLLKVRPQILSPFYCNLLKISDILSLILIKNKIYACLKLYYPMQHDLDIKLFLYLFFIRIYPLSHTKFLVVVTVEKSKNDEGTIMKIFSEGELECMTIG